MMPIFWKNTTECCSRLQERVIQTIQSHATRLIHSLMEPKRATRTNGHANERRLVFNAYNGKARMSFQIVQIECKNT